mmetsp:Transcript_24567/g.52940  ORF Transcript_24567/g.52940 Transcript_24567/m.52940 type:complete len:217 (+) Transcript_24567:1078-1728(+)
MIAWRIGMMSRLGRVRAHRTLILDPSGSTMPLEPSIRPLIAPTSWKIPSSYSSSITARLRRTRYGRAASVFLNSCTGLLANYLAPLMAWSQLSTLDLPCSTSRPPRTCMTWTARAGKRPSTTLLDPVTTGAPTAVSSSRAARIARCAADATSTCSSAPTRPRRPRPLAVGGGTPTQLRPSSTSAIRVPGHTLLRIQRMRVLRPSTSCWTSHRRRQT